MQVAPTSLVRICRYYLLTAAWYLLLTIVLGVLRVAVGLPDERMHWIPAILGWVSFPIMGAYYQFFPTLQGRELRYERLALPQFVLVNCGILGMSLAAWFGSAAIFSSSLIVYAVGALLFVALILANVTSPRLNLTLRFYIASLGYFAIAVILMPLGHFGLAPTWVDRPLLLHLFVFGWAILATMGAQYAMVPMLQLKELRHAGLAGVQFYLANAATIGLTFGIASRRPVLLALGGALALVAIAVFVYIIGSTLRSGPARLKKLDLSVRFFLVGIAYLVASAVLGTYAGLTNAYALAPVHLHLGLIGVISNTIVGASYHIVPFVVWWEVYAPRMGGERVPLLRELFDERSAERQLYGLNAGLLLMVAGFALAMKPLLVVGGLLLMLVALAFVHQLFRVVAHRRLDATRASSRQSA